MSIGFIALDVEIRIQNSLCSKHINVFILLESSQRTIFNCDQNPRYFLSLSVNLYFNLVVNFKS